MRSFPVKPDWPRDRSACKIAFVGEAPSDEELLKGLPLVGPSGRLYDRLLALAGIDRAEVLTTNVFNVQIPDNDLKKSGWLMPTSEMMKLDFYPDTLSPFDRGQWLRPEHLHHLYRLAEEIEACEPHVIVPLGGTALWAFTGATGIMARRGFVDTGAEGLCAPGVKLVPALHPAALFRMWKYYVTTVKDFERAAAESEFPEVRHPKMEVWVEPTLDDIHAFKQLYLDDAEIIGIDIETYPRRRALTHVSFAATEDRALVIPFVNHNRPDNSYWSCAEDEVLAVQLVKAICESPVPKVLQNGVYDARWLWETWGIRLNNYLHDTRLLHHALWPELDKSLDFMVSSILPRGPGPWKLMNVHDTGKRDE